MQIDFVHASNDLLFGDSNPLLRNFLIASFREIAYAYVVDWIPDQGFEVYTVVIPEGRVVVLELYKNKLDGDNSVTGQYGIQEYKRRFRPGRELRDKLIEVEIILARK